MTTTTNPVDVYLEASDRHDRAEIRCRNYANVLSSVEKDMHRPGRLHFHTEGAAGEEPRIAVTPSSATKVTATSDMWPSLEDVRDAMEEWRQADQAVRSAWDAVPKNRRAGLQPPPDRPLGY